MQKFFNLTYILVLYNKLHSNTHPEESVADELAVKIACTFCSFYDA